MGGNIVLPEADENITKCIKNFMLTPKEIAKFYKIFNKMDEKKTGFVRLDVIFKKAHYKRNLMTDCILELLDIEHDGELNFSEFTFMLCQYCFFEPPQIIRYMFFCFDQDQSGFFEVSDLYELVNSWHDLEQKPHPKDSKLELGQVKKSWANLTFDGDKIDSDELTRINVSFPNFFRPAFRLQQKLQAAYMGEIWWTKKKRNNQNFRENADAIIAKKRAASNKKKLMKKERKIIKNMGILRYYACPWNRKLYDPTRTAYDNLTDEEKAQKDREFALAKRQAELKVKNPETYPWRKYQAKAMPEHGGNVEFLQERIFKVEKEREYRSENREERREKRKMDEDLRQKKRMTISGVDV